MLIVGKQAPEFVLNGVKDGNIISVNSLQFLGKYVFYFFFPNDFSEVCPTEIFGLDQNIDEFNKRNVHVLAVSPDSIFAHLEWLKTPIEESGIQGVRLTLLSDIKKNLARAYGILDEEKGIPFRGAFIVNRQGRVVYGSVNNLFIGRSTDELVRLIDAFQYTEKNEVMCPIDWEPGSETIPANRRGCENYYQRKFG
jgi:alkyl hydroperoxide reductase subunit AhpC